MNRIEVSCCRTCLRIDCTLTPTSTEDSDSVKYEDKLSCCVSEVSWSKEGYPPVICEHCIEKLRAAYDFRTMCVQSDGALARYLEHIPVDGKLEVSLEERPLNTPTKFEFEITTQENSGTELIVEDQQSDEYLHLKHFLDNDDLNKLERDKSQCSTPNDDQDFITEDLNDDRQLQGICVDDDQQIPSDDPQLVQLQESIDEHQQTEIDFEEQIDFQIKVTETQIIQGDEMSTLTNEASIQTQVLLPETNAMTKLPAATGNLRMKQVIKRTTGTQVRLPTPTNDTEIDGKKLYSCVVCNKQYRKNANLRIHMRTHTGEKPFECKYCDKRFYHSSHLREHIRRHTGEKPFQCAVCNKRFTIKGELTMHMKSHTGEKPYACTCCDRRCLTSADLKVHMRTHTGEKPFTCTTCGKKFASTYILNSHIKTHTGERPYACKECDKKFTQSSHLNVHMRKHTGEKASCRLCGAKFTHSSQLTVHMREHTGKQPYKCSICDKVCNYASELQVHVMKHTGQRFGCVTCDKNFTTLAYLNEHNRTHTGENLSTCTICDRRFTRHQYLVKHMRTHTGEKPYTCAQCGKSFTQSSSLRVHMRIHTGEKPYACTQCEKRFTTSSDLSVHSKKHKKYIML